MIITTSPSPPESERCHHLRQNQNDVTISVKNQRSTAREKEEREQKLNIISPPFVASLFPKPINREQYRSSLPPPPPSPQSCGPKTNPSLTHRPCWITSCVRRGEALTATTGLYPPNTPSATSQTKRVDHVCVSPS